VVGIRGSVSPPFLLSFRDEGVLLFFLLLLLGGEGVSWSLLTSLS
jgi:hypothetical protein